MRNHILLTILLLFLAATSAAWGTDWPQAGGNAARTSYTPDEPLPTFAVAWTKTFTDGVIQHGNVPIVIGSTTYMGTPTGKVYGWSLSSGSELWTPRDLGASAGIVASLAGDGTRVYVAALNGTLYAINPSTGAIMWQQNKSNRGFSAAPLLFDGKLFIGNRDGKFFAVDPSNGNNSWTPYDSGAPIVAAAAGDSGKVVFTNEAGNAFCINSSNGTVVWGPLAIGGRTMRDFWPVIANGRVFFRTANAAGRELAGKPTVLQDYVVAQSGTATSIAEIIAEQATLQTFFTGKEYAQNFRVRNLSDGSSSSYVPSVQHGCRNRGTFTPVIQAQDSGGALKLWVMFKTTAAVAGFVDISEGGLGRFDDATGRLAEPLLCGRGDLGDIIGRGDTAFELTTDETVTLTGAGKRVFGMHTDQSPGWVKTDSSQGGSFPEVDLPRNADIQAGPTHMVISGPYVLITRQNTLIVYSGQGGGGGDPVVTVAATDNAAAEPSDDGLFTVTRSSTSGNLVVNIAMTGTATNGTDYNNPGGIGTTVTIANGSSSATVLLDVYNDSTPETNETAILTVQSGAGYTVGSPGSATVDITDNDSSAPVAYNDSYSVNEDNSLYVSSPGVLGNDTGSNLTAIKVTDPSHGSVTLNSNGSFTYTPSGNYFGTDSYTYKANDGSQDSNTATVNITVNPVNDAPVAVADSYSTSQDTPLTVTAPGVLTNDTDVEGSNLTAAKVSDPSHGSVTLNSNGSFTYTPTGGYSGTDAFTYKANDGSADSNTVAVDITVSSSVDLTTALVTKWNFNEGSGTSAADTAPYGVQADTGTLTGGAVFNGSGAVGGSVTFDGSNDYVAVADSNDINTTTVTTRTLSFWFYVTNKDITANKQFIFEFGSNADGMCIYVYGGSLYVGGWNASAGWNSGTFLSTSAITNNTWYNVVVTLDGEATLQPDRLKGYLNGQPFGSGQGMLIDSSTNDTGVGRVSAQSKAHDGNLNTTGHYFGGRIDEGRIFNRVLNSAEISALAAGG